MSELEEAIKKAKKINGIIRRLDELGRIVMPKDYRKGKVKDGETKVAIYHIKDYVVVEIIDQTSDTNKKFDELGRIVINIEIRDELGWKEKDSIETWNFGKYFILKKLVEECAFCGKEKSLIEYKDKKVCEKCKNELAGM